MKINDIVIVCDGSYSKSLIKGAMQHSDGNSLKGRRFQVHGVGGAYPTDGANSFSGTNNALLVDVDDPDFVLFTQERFCRVVVSVPSPLKSALLEVTISHETREIRLVLQK